MGEKNRKIKLGKTKIKIYQEFHEMPVLPQGDFNALQGEMQNRITLVQHGKRPSFLGFAGKKLTPREKLDEINFIIKNYDAIITLLVLYKDDFARLFRGIAAEIPKVIQKSSQRIAKLESERIGMEQRARLENNAMRIQKYKERELNLFKVTRALGLGATLMLEKLTVMDSSIKKLANDKTLQRQTLKKMLAELDWQRQDIEWDEEFGAVSKEVKLITKAALNLEENMKQYLGPLQGLIEQVGKIDKELAGAVSRIQDISNQIINDELSDFSAIPTGKNTNQILDFLMYSNLPKEQLNDVFVEMEAKNITVQFDSDLAAKDSTSIQKSLDNIHSYIDIELGKFGVSPRKDKEIRQKQDAESVWSEKSKSQKQESLFNIEPFTEGLNLPSGSTKLEMVAVPSRSYKMGGTHQVSISAFSMGKYQITQVQYESVMGTNPSRFKGANLPVEQVSWNDATAFCQKLSKQTGKQYRLPSEAEWEYACRAGSTTKYCFGDSDSQLKDYAWYDDNSGKTTHPVGQRKANVWGLYDMHGNVWEWCGDNWESDLSKLPKDGKVLLSSGDSSRHPNRGGSWFNASDGCHSESRYDLSSDSGGNDLGFRVVCVGV
jgi:formylglycine-generating enzyme required for sulfatase activity